MGIGITQEQRELAEAVRGWVARAAPPEEVRKLLDTPPQTGARPAYWDAMTAQGLLDPHLDGGTLLDLAVVVEQAARAALPGAYLPSALASVLLDRAGAEPLEGRVGAVALGPGTLTAVAAPGGGYLLDGLAPPVLGAGEADLVLLAAEAAHGTRWFAVDAAALDIRTHESADPTRPTAEVRARGSPPARTGCWNWTRPWCATWPARCSPPTPAAPPPGPCTPPPSTRRCASSSAGPSGSSRA